MKRRPVLGSLDQMVGSLTEEDRTRLEMDTFVLVSHKQRPHWMRLVDLDGAIGIIQTGMIHDCVDNRLVHLLPVNMNLTHIWPKHVVLVHVVPQHFIDSNFKDTLKVSIDRLGKNTTDTKLVNVKTGSMSIIKDLRVAQTMDRRTV
jgi:hypothetical protein